ncbi:MAG: 4-alpha-glucanotransferase [Acutalibacteraceae bacterium]|jgi:4-alpha-glucanotransferase|nr:4-alpha-glucanotransferase [Clostridiales bacterium]
MRASGILMHISSLPSNYGIGTLGQEAYNFVDFLKKSGQTYWQILPICPTGFGDSPYQTFSSYAGNPYFIDLDFLIDEGLLKKEECSSINWGDYSTSVDYKRMYDNRFDVLKKAYKRFIKSVPDDFEQFCKRESYWLCDYALFMSIKTQTGKIWSKWDDELKFRDEKAIKDFKSKNSDDVMFYKVIQYLFFSQWHKLKEYANKNGIQIIGDIPIYVASDSVDVWVNPELFLLNEDNEPTYVSGCPPDSFSKDGQLWGNPIYDWNKMKEDDYAWWIKRLKYVSEIYDITRIDHFRGFDSYYTIDANAKTARKGVWVKGPGIEFFNSVKKELGSLNIIAEDLGFLTPSVHRLLKRTGFPGMKVLQFAFDSREDSDYLPHNYPKNTVVYTGTHDNDTIIGWMQTAKKQDVKFAIDYLRLNQDEGYNWGMMKGAWASVANTVIVTMQDLQGLDSKARMNIPSTVGDNWKWRAARGSMSNTLAKKINRCMKIYKRV